MEALEPRDVPAGFAPVVTPPGVQVTVENATFNFGSASAFNITDRDDAGGLYTATVAVTNGTTNRTTAVTGTLAALNSSFALDGFLKYTPTAFYAGDGTVTVTVTDADSNAGAGQTNVRVVPTPQRPTLTAPPGLILRPGVATPLRLSLAGSFDADGSESYFVDFTFPPPGTFSPGGTDLGGGILRFPASALPTLTFTVPADTPIGTMVTFTAATFTRDVADYDLTGGTITADQRWPAQTFTADVRLSAPQVNTAFAPRITERDSVTFGGGGTGDRFVLTDDDDIGGVYTLSIGVEQERGRLVFSAVGIAAYGLTLDNDVTSAVLTGPRANLNGFLDVHGVTYVPETYSGNVDLVLAVTDDSDLSGTGTGRVLVDPVAAPPLVTVVTPAVTNIGVPVLLRITANVDADLDGSEMVDYIDLHPDPNFGYPDGVFNRGEFESGVLRLTRAELVGLTFTPAATAVPGDYALTVRSRASDAASVGGTPVVDLSEETVRTFVLRILAPEPNPFTFENVPFTFSGANGNAFSFDDPNPNETTGGTGEGDPEVTTPRIFNVTVEVAEGGVTLSSESFSGTLDQLNGLFADPGFTYTPTAFFSGVAEVAVSTDAQIGGRTVRVDVLPVALVPQLTVETPAVAEVGVPANIFITTDVGLDANGFGDFDGSESVAYVEILGAPPGTFSAGSYIATTNAWQFTLDDLSGLTFTPADGVGGTFPLVVRAVAQDNSDEYSATSEVAVADLELIVRTAPYLERAQVFVLENQAVVFASGVFPFVLRDDDLALNPDGLYTLTLSDQLAPVNGFFFVDSVLAAGYEVTVDGSGTNVLTLTGTLARLREVLNDAGLLIYSPPTYFAGEHTAFVVTLTDPDGLTTIDDRDLRISPVADPPELTAVTPVIATPGDTVPFTVTAVPYDTDGSERVLYVDFVTPPELIGLGFFNLGAVNPNDASRWRVSAADLPLLTFTVDAGAAGSGTFRFDIFSATIDAPFFSGEPVAATSTEAYAFIDLVLVIPPTIQVPESVDAVENNTFSFTSQVFSLADAGESTDPYTLVIATADGFLSFNATFAFDVYGVVVEDNETAAVTLTGTIDGIEGLLNTDAFRYVPTPYFSGPTAVTYRLTDPEGGVATASTAVLVAPVADPPRVFAETAYGTAGEPIPLDVIALPIDTDGSEFVLDYAFFEYPAGTTFSAGAEEIIPGLDRTGWRVEAADIADLTITLPAGAVGVYPLQVFARTEDRVLGASSGPMSGYAVRDFVVDTRIPPAVDLTNVLNTPEGGPYNPNDIFFSATLFDDPVDISGPYTLVVTAPAGQRITTDVTRARIDFDVTVTGNTTAAVRLTGAFDDLQNFVNAYGLSVRPPVFFSGELELQAFLQSPDGRRGFDTSFALVTPTASVLAPAVVPVLGGRPGAEVPLRVLVPATPDRDGSEDVEVDISGVPNDVTFTTGEQTGSGVWRFTPEELEAAAVVIPGGATPGTTYTFTATVRVTDTALYPQLGEPAGTDTAERSANFLVRVVDPAPPAAAPTATAPGTFDIVEQNSANFQFQPNSVFDPGFQIADADALTDPNGVYTVYLRSESGFLDVYGVGVGEPGGSVTVTGRFSNLVTLTGTLPELNARLKVGFYEYRDQYYSGEGYVTLDVVDPTGLVGGNGVRFRVLPQASFVDCVVVAPYHHGNVGDWIPTPISTAEPFDRDGSERVYAELRTPLLAEGAIFSAGFRDEDADGDYWVVEEADFARLRFLPPVGFFGQLTLDVRIGFEDRAEFPHFSGPDATGQDTNENFGSTLVTVAAFAHPVISVPGVQFLDESGNAAGATFATFAGDTAVSVGFFTADGGTVTLSVENGRAFFRVLGDPTGSTGDGTGQLVISGTREFINEFLAVGFDVVPDAHYSGDIPIRVEAAYLLVSNFGPTIPILSPGLYYDYAGLNVKVSPVASVAEVTVNGNFDIVIPVRGESFALADGFVTLAPWPDRDFSEFGYVYVNLSGIPDATGFTLTSPATGSNPLQFGAGSWFLFASDPENLQTQLNSLVLTAPTGFAGEVVFTTRLELYDFTHFQSDCTNESSFTFDIGSAVFNFLAGPTVAVETDNPPTITERDEGANLAGIVTLADPNTQAGDVYSLTLSVGRGELRVDESLLPAGVGVTDNPAADVTLTGSLADLQAALLTDAFFAATLDPTFSGLVPVVAGLDLIGSTYRTAVATGAVVVYPVASELSATADPVVAVAVGPAGTAFGPTPVNVSIPASPDTDEEVLLYLYGSRGTFNQGEVRLINVGDGGIQAVWVFTPADLIGLTFTPAVEGEQHWSLTVEVTDRADLAPYVLPQDSVDFSSNTTSLNVTVIRIDTLDFEVPENSAAGTVVGTLTVTGLPDENYGFELVPDDGSEFEVLIDGTILVGDVPLDFEDGRTSFTLSVRLLRYEPDLVGAFGPPAGPFVTIDLGTFPVLVTVQNVNEVPTVVGPDPIDGNEDESVAVTGLSFTAEDAGTNSVQVTLTVTGGTLVLNDGDDGLTFDGDGTDTLTITGPVGAINFFLNQTAGVSFAPTSNVSARTTLTATIIDFINPEAVSNTVDVVTRPVADEVDTPVGTPQMAAAGTTVPLTFEVADFVTDDNDGSETVRLYLTGVPAGATLSGGFDLGGGVWVLAETDLPGLTFAPPPGPQTITLGVYAEVRDEANIDPGDPMANIFTTNTTTFDLTFFPAAPPTVAVTRANTGVEDTPVTTPFILNFTADNVGLGDVTVTLTITDGDLNFGTRLPLVVVDTGSAVTITGSLVHINFALGGQMASLTYIPTAQFAGLAEFTATIDDGFTTATSPVVPFAVAPVADDVPPPNGYTATAPAGTPVRTDIQAVFTTADFEDGSERVVVEISGVPAGASFSRGTSLGGGVWQFEEGQTSDLTFTPPAGFIGDIVLTARSIVTDTADTLDAPATATDTFTSADATIVLRFLDPPTVSIEQLGNGREDTPNGDLFAVSVTAPAAVGPVTVTLTVTRGALAFISPFSDLTVTNTGTGTVTITGPVGRINAAFARQFGAILFTPDVQYAGPAEFTAAINDGFTTATAPGVPFAIDPVADEVNRSFGTDVLGAPNATVPLQLLAALRTTDDDGSEAVSIFISNVPAGATLNRGTNRDGTWVLTPADFATLTLTPFNGFDYFLVDGLTFTPPADFVGTISLGIQGVVDDTVGPASDTFRADPTTVTLRFAVPQQPQPPTVTGPNAPAAVEDVPTTITGLRFAAPDNPTGIATVTLSVTHGTLSIQESFSPLSVRRVSENTVVLTSGSAAAITAYLDSHPLTFTPDANYAGLAAFTVSINDRLNPTTTAARDFVIAPVADPVGPPTGEGGTVPAGTPAPLAIAGPSTTADTDGSETVRFVISGVPNGATLNRGTFQGGVWVLSAGDLAGLTLTPPGGFAGTIDLNVRSRVIDTVVTGTASGGTFLTATDIFETPDSPFTVVVTPPTFSLTFSGGAVDENVPAGTEVGRVGVTASGPTGETFAFALVEATGYAFTVEAATGRVLIGTSPNFELIDAASVTVRAVGSLGTTLVQTFPVRIHNVNEAPVLHGLAVGDATEDTPRTIAGLSVGDPDGAVTVRVTLSVAHGTLTVAGTAAGNGTAVVTLTGTVDQLNAIFAAGIGYAPTADYAGADNFAVFVDDLGNSGSGSPLSASASAAFNVIAVADLPTLTAADATGDEGGTLGLTLAAATTDADGSETVTVIVRGLPAGYSLVDRTRNTAGDYVLTAADLAGLTLVAPQDSGGPIPVTVVARATEATNGAFAEVTRTLNLTVRNVAPALTGLAGGTVEVGQPFAVPLGSFADPGAEPLWTATVDFGDGTPVVSFAATPGSLGNRSHAYAAAGTFTVTLSVFDGTDTTTTTSTVVVTPPPVANAPPVAVVDEVRTAFGTPTAFDVLANDSDPDGDTLTIVGFASAANGVVTVGEDGVPRYTPAAGFSGVDVFEYTISDGQGNTATGSVFVIVDPPGSVPPPENQAPVAGDDLVTTPADSAVTFDILHNDTDADGDAVSVIDVDTPAHGTVTLLGAQVVYTPNAGFAGTDSFAYTITDGHGHTATATARVVVRPQIRTTEPAASPAPQPISPPPPGVPPTEAAALQFALTTIPGTARTAPSRTPPATPSAEVSIPLVSDVSMSSAVGGSGSIGDPYIAAGEGPIGFLVLAPSDGTPAPAAAGRLVLDQMPISSAAAGKSPATFGLATPHKDRPAHTAFGLGPTELVAGIGESDTGNLEHIAEMYEKHLNAPATVPAAAGLGGKPPAAPAQEAPPPDPLDDDAQSQAPADAQGPAWGMLAFLGAVAVAAAPLSSIFASTPDVRRRLSLTGTPDEDES